MLMLSGKGQSKLKLSGNGNECKPLCGGGGVRWRVGRQRLRRRRGRAVQFDPIKPTLKAPGTKRLKLDMVNCFQLFL
jgi:hypothetical protein